MINLAETEQKAIPAHILVVEDEPEIRELIGLHLRRSGYSTTEVSNASEALHALSTVNPDIVCLDWMLPGLSGVEMLQMLRLREEGKNIPVLMLTAKTEPEDIVAGLEAGADDYMTKPFDTKVLHARIYALLRRVERFRKIENNEVVKLGTLEIDMRSYELRNMGELVHLTPSEFKLVSTLAMSAGRVLTRDQLIQEVQGDGISVVGRTVDTHIFGLRKKLKENGDIIETIRGVGYRIRVPKGI